MCKKSSQVALCYQIPMTSMGLESQKSPHFWNYVRGCFVIYLSDVEKQLCIGFIFGQKHNSVS